MEVAVVSAKSLFFGQMAQSLCGNFDSLFSKVSKSHFNANEEVFLFSFPAAVGGGGGRGGRGEFFP